MSFFGVTVETIGSLETIPGADRIVKATLTGIDFSFVVQKGAFEVGGPVLYIPVDAIVPEDVLTKLGLVGKLGGKAKNRVKTIKLKGVYSQGIAAPMSLIDGLGSRDPERITKYLGITKWEPDEHNAHVNKVVPWYTRFFKWVRSLFIKPELVELSKLGIPVYDIEGCNRYKHLVESLMDTPVCVTLKVEGQNAAVLVRDGKVYVNQRRYTINDKTDKLWKLATSSKIIDFAKHLSVKYGRSALVYFEATGSDKGAAAISGNIYGFQEYRPFIFDIKLGEFFMNRATMYAEINSFFGNQDIAAPVLCFGETLKEFLGEKTLEAAAEQSNILRMGGLEEGIVIVPMMERSDNSLGRVILKYRSKAYLAQQG